MENNVSKSYFYLLILGNELIKLKIFTENINKRVYRFQLFKSIKTNLDLKQGEKINNLSISNIFLSAPALF